MKRTLVCALAVALLAACSSQEEDFKTPHKDDVIYYASFEQPTEDGTRVYANEDLLLRWNADDRVSIFGKNTYNQQYKFLGETGDNSGGFSKVDGAEYVTGNPISHTVSVYPYLESTKISESEIITVSLPAEQHYAENTFGLDDNTMVSVSADNFLQYKNVGGYLVLKLYGNDVSVSSITLKGNNGEKLAGNATVSMPVDSDPSVSMASDASTEITLTCETPVRLGATTEESTLFWFVVPPITFSKGFTITVKDDDHCIFEKSTEKSLEIVRNIMTKMSAFEVIPTPSLKAFAQEFVKGLDVWATTVGTVESDGQHLIEKGTAWENAHFIPIVPNPDCEFLGHEGNQYDHKYVPWVLNVAGREISSSQAWEIAIRGLMNLVTAEGEAFLPTMDNRNKAYTLANNQSFSQAMMPKPSEANKWGKHPWYEGDDLERIWSYGEEIESVDVNFMVKVGAWHVVRSFVKTAGNNLPLGMIGNFQQFGTSSSTLNLEGYEGLISPMRELLVLMRIYKYILDNNIDANVYDSIKDQKFDFDLYGIPSIPVPEAVDLGLSVKWASFNVGAKKPEDFGKYYSFGETKGYGEEDFSNLSNFAWNNYSSYIKTVFYFDTYKWNAGGSSLALTKYSDVPEFGYKGFIDNKTILEPQDDAASVNWSINWRTPTKAEWEELADNTNCSWTLETINGINGYRVTSKKAGFTNASIFLPLAGNYAQDSYYIDGTSGSYMAANIYELPQRVAQACQLYSFKLYSTNLGSAGTHFVTISFRECGYSVRPVYSEPEDGVLGIELNQSVLRLNVNESADLSATVFPENALNKSLTWSSSDASVATVSASGKVTARRMGAATITVNSINNKTAACIVNVVKETGAIDLGLSVRWAPFNIGALAPEEYGDYFAWGETVPYYQPGYAQSENPVWRSGKEAGYTNSSYIWGNGASSYTRYSSSDGKTDFSDYDFVDDAARANWGGSWRTPTQEEWRQLQNQCDWKWTTQEGVNGYLVTSKKNGNYIFLPAAGQRSGTRLYSLNSSGSYMQSKFNNETSFSSTSINVYGLTARTMGFSIRPVTE